VKGVILVADFYTEKVLEHFRNPRNSGEIEDADAIGDVGNPVCGDLMRISMKINDETEVIEDIKFRTFGCGAAIATSSIITEMVKGKTIGEALQISNKDVIAALGGLPAVKIHCSVLAEEGIVKALKQYFDNHPEKTPPAYLEEKAKLLAAVEVHEH
jgi:nitrogen fixation NifU-like protein